MNTQIDDFDSLVADIETETDLSGFPKLPEGWFRSIKYLIESESVWHAYIFSTDPFAAEEKARAEFGIPDNEEVRVTRVVEGSVDKARYGKEHTAIHPD